MYSNASSHLKSFIFFCLICVPTFASNFLDTIQLSIGRTRQTCSRYYTSCSFIFHSPNLPPLSLHSTFNAKLHHSTPHVNGAPLLREIGPSNRSLAAIFFKEQKIYVKLHPSPNVDVSQ